MADHRSSPLDQFLREYREERAKSLPGEIRMPEARRDQLLEVVRQGIPRPQRRHRTEYEDQLEEKRLARQESRAAARSAARQLIWGFVLRFIGAAAVLLVVVGLIFWWMDRRTRREVELAGLSAPSETGTPMMAIGGGGSAGEEDFFGSPAASPASPVPAPAARSAGAGAESTASKAAAPPAPAPPPAAVSPLSTPLIAPAFDATQMARLAALAATVSNKLGGVRVDFDPVPVASQKRRNAVSIKHPLAFQRVRVVQNQKGIELVDRWDGSFFRVQVRAVTPAEATPPSRQVVEELLGRSTDLPVVLRLEGEAIHFSLNQKVHVTAELALEEVPPRVVDLLAEADPDRAFAAWVTHSRLFGEAQIADGEQVIFEQKPASE